MKKITEIIEFETSKKIVLNLCLKPQFEVGDMVHYVDSDYIIREGRVASISSRITSFDKGHGAKVKTEISYELDLFQISLAFFKTCKEARIWIDTEQNKRKIEKIEYVRNRLTEIEKEKEKLLLDLKEEEK